MDTAQEIRVKIPNRPQGTSPGNCHRMPTPMKSAHRTMSRVASTRAPQVSLAP